MVCLLRKGVDQGFGFLLRLRHFVGFEYTSVWRLDIKPTFRVESCFVMSCFVFSFLPPQERDVDMFGAELFLGDREDFSHGKPCHSVAASLEENKCEVWERKSEL